MLMDMVRQGAKLLATDCQMKAVVAEIESAVDLPISKSK
jgi:hypothetical protein